MEAAQQGRKAALFIIIADVWIKLSHSSNMQVWLKSSKTQKLQLQKNMLHLRVLK